jgi:hypothetical protein
VGVDVEVFLAAGYAAFLLGVALGVDLMARHSQARSDRYRTAGFTYHPKHDAWICPEEQVLTRSETDRDRRVVRYRGRPQICNHCPSKADCTDSDEGREVVRPMDPWPHSEAGRFHRGISLCVALVAGLILAAETLRNHAPLELLVLGAALVVVALAAWHLHSAFRSTPANFPVFQPMPSSTILREDLRTGYKKDKEVRH